MNSTISLGTDFRTLLLHSSLTQEQAARVCGVSLRTVQNWLAGKTTPGQRAIFAIKSAVAQYCNTCTSLDERIAVLTAVSKHQQQRVFDLEDELAAERGRLAETNRTLNALYDECGKR